MFYNSEIYTYIKSYKKVLLVTVKICTALFSVNKLSLVVKWYLCGISVSLTTIDLPI